MTIQTTDSLRASALFRGAQEEYRREHEVSAPRSKRAPTEPAGAYDPPGELLRVSPPEPEAAGGFVPAYTKGLRALTGAELLRAEFPAREFLMSPWLPSKGLAMIFAERGIGKTWVGLNIAHATAGRRFIPPLARALSQARRLYRRRNAGGDDQGSIRHDRRRRRLRRARG